MATTQKLTAKDLAEQLGIDSRDLRKWLRSHEMGVGRGGKKYEFTAQQATKLIKQFQAEAEEENAEDVETEEQAA
jgi:transposase-like protein